MQSSRLIPLTLALLPFFSGMVWAEGNEVPPKSSVQPASSSRTAPVFITADHIEGHQDAEVKAEGAVELHQDDRSLFADNLFYDVQKDEIFATGNVKVEQRGDIMRGPELKLNLETYRGYMETPVYELGAKRARGDADKAWFEGKDKTLMDRARYTTCPVDRDDWFVRARKLDLDRTTQVGTAYHASIVFKDVPFLYTPYMTFPLSDQRKSGFLTPEFGTTGNSGTNITIPYYWNIAPNYDATITPRLLSKRGVLLSGEFRYLQRDYAGQLDAAILHNDRVARMNRHALSLKHGQTLYPGLTGTLDLNRVSDDAYYRDLSTSVTTTTITNLVREGALSYAKGSWNLTGRIQRFQTLQDPLAPITPPYERTPQLLLTGVERDIRGTDIALDSEFVNFQHATSTAGKRLVLYPSVSVPLSRSYGYITPKLGLHYTRYTLDRNSTTLPDSTRTVPIFSLDGGLFFERPWEFGGNDFLQTLEPRLYYVYIPFRDQNQLPNFDSGEMGFDFGQMFTENLFSGRDRIGDANQITFALTSRLLNPYNGQERLRAAVGQRYYFKDQQVTISGAPRTLRYSDVLAAVSGQITPKWWIDSGLQYSTHLRRTERFNVGARYQPQMGKVLNLSYRYLPDTLKQIDTSAQWALGGRWNGLARWNYSINDKQTLEGLAGLEYNAGCWVVRAVAHRLTTSSTLISNSFFIQLELSGVGKIGSDPLDVLKRSIYGYTKTNDILDQSAPNPLP